MASRIAGTARRGVGIAAKFCAGSSRGVVAVDSGIAIAEAEPAGPIALTPARDSAEGTSQPSAAPAAGTLDLQRQTCRTKLERTWSSWNDAGIAASTRRAPTPEVLDVRHRGFDQMTPLSLRNSTLRLCNRDWPNSHESVIDAPVALVKSWIALTLRGANAAPGMKPQLSPLRAARPAQSQRDPQCAKSKVQSVGARLTDSRFRRRPDVDSVSVPRLNRHGKETPQSCIDPCTSSTWHRRRFAKRQDCRGSCVLCGAYEAARALQARKSPPTIFMIAALRFLNDKSSQAVGHITIACPRRI